MPEQHEVGRFHYVWPDGDQDGRCTDPTNCYVEVHYVITRERRATVLIEEEETKEPTQ